MSYTGLLGLNAVPSTEEWIHEAVVPVGLGEAVHHTGCHKFNFCSLLEKMVHQTARVPAYLVNIVLWGLITP